MYVVHSTNNIVLCISTNLDFKFFFYSRIVVDPCLFPKDYVSEEIHLNCTDAKSLVTNAKIYFK